MKIYDFTNEKGNITALILIERTEIESCEAEHGEFAVEQAITNAILSIADRFELTFMFTKVLSCDVQEDGAAMVRFETAAAPEVALGQYRGLCVPSCEDPDAFADKAVALAAEQISAEVPAMIVERELDALLNEKKSSVLQNVHLNLLTDIHKILEETVRDVSCDWDKDLLWKQAVETTELYFGAGKPELSLDHMVSAVVNVLSLYGKVDDPILVRVTNTVEHRMTEREKLTGEALAEQVFETYLRLSDFSREQWFENNRPEALARTRQNLTLDAIAQVESITVSDGEVQEQIRSFAEEFSLDEAQVREIVSEDALRYDLRRSKARKLVADSAIRI